MALLSRAISNLFNGISQQPAALRHPTQAEVMENCYPTIASGLGKRPPTEHVAKISSTPVTSAHVATINRDTSERYELILTNGAIQVYDLYTGAAKAVNAPSGLGYLAVADASQDFRVVTVADYSFIVNRTKVVAMMPGPTGVVLKGTKQKYTDLPTTGQTAGDVWQIIGDPTNTYDNYYVKWTGVWVECTAPNTPEELNKDTMPHKLVREADGTFTFAPLDWDKRLVGDVASNPDPSFVGRTITDILFYRNRLGFLSDEAIILSRSAKYYNFWAESITAVLDSDPIDNSASSTKVSILRSAITFNKALLLFSDLTQFQLASGDVLTPKTVKLEAVTEFESSGLVKPVAAGQNVFFALDVGEYSQIREYFVDSDTYSNDASDITAHVPKYVPSGIYKMAASSNADVVLALSLKERNALYVYKYYWGASEKLQSAWGKFLFDSTDTLLNADIIGNVVYLTVQRTDGIYLEKLDLQPGKTDGTLGYLVHLDRKVSLTGTYSAVTGFTTWTVPFTATATLSAVLGDGFGPDSGTLLSTTQPTPTTIQARGNFSTSTVYIGRQYTKRYRFSQLYLRDTNNVSTLEGRLQLRYFRCTYADTGYFRAEVTLPGRDKGMYPFVGKTLGETIIGKQGITSGTFQFPVMSDSKRAVIELVNDSHLPSFIQSAEWTATHSTVVSRNL